MAPAGAVGLTGVVGSVGAVVPGGAVVGLGVGKVGSVGPDPGEATGLPSMVVLQPATSAVAASRAAIPRAMSDSRTRYSRKSEISGVGYARGPAIYCSDALLQRPA